MKTTVEKLKKEKKDPGFESGYFDTVDELIEAKDDALSVQRSRRARLKAIRDFVNMKPTLTDEEMEVLGRTEATNFGTLYRDMQALETMFSGMTSFATGKHGLVEIVVDTDNPEIDYDLTARASECVNRGALTRKGKFNNFWKAAAGESVISGGAPVVMPQKFGWCPEVRPDMVFPRETSLDSDKVTYAFDPVELSMDKLKKYLKSAEKNQAGIFQVGNIKDLIDLLTEQIKDRRTKEFGSTARDETSRSVRDESFRDSSPSISAWWYYEVKFEDNGDRYVSATLFTDGIESDYIRGRRNASRGKVIAYWNKSYDMAAEWLTMVAIDSEIGGVKNHDTLVGMAEKMFPAGLEMEELFNLILEGDKIRAKPKYRLNEAEPGFNEDKILKWNIALDGWVPSGVEEFEFKTNAQHLLTPISYLRGITTSMSAGGTSGTTGKDRPLRVQEIEQQRGNVELRAARLVEAYNHLDTILESVVWRLLAGPVKAGTEGYQETMWVRDKLNAYLRPYGLDCKKLAERKYGRFLFLEVRARRVVGGGNRAEQLEIADWLMKNLVNYPPQNRPQILRLATVLLLGDPDLADQFSTPQKWIINSQRVTAENERDTIRARVALGEVLPVMPEDIHQDHIMTHMKDMNALIQRDQLRPWDTLDMLEFAGMTEHTAEHIRILMQNPATNPEAKAFTRGFANLVAAAGPIGERVEEEQGSEQMQLTPAEQAKMELAVMQEQRKWAELGVRVEDGKKLEQSRIARHQLSQRAQFAREINQSEQQKDNRVRLELDAKKTEAQVRASKKPTKSPG